MERERRLHALEEWLRLWQLLSLDVEGARQAEASPRLL